MDGLANTHFKKALFFQQKNMRMIFGLMNTDIFCLPKFIFLMASNRLPKGVMSWDLNLEYT